MEETSKEEIGKFIKIKLIESNTSQRDAANYLGIKPPNLSRKIKTGTFSATEMEQLAQLMGYKIEWVKLPTTTPAPEQPVTVAPEHTTGTH